MKTLVLALFLGGCAMRGPFPLQTMPGLDPTSSLLAIDQAAYKLVAVRSWQTDRVADGQHSVPSKDVARRYGRSLSNLPAAFVLAERIFILDNTRKKLRLLLSVENNRVKHLSRNLPQWAKEAIPPRFIRSEDLDMLC